jgi:hypothetical protein
VHFQNAMLLASLGLLPGEAAPYQRILQAVQERELGPDDMTNELVLDLAELVHTQDKKTAVPHTSGGGLRPPGPAVGT